MQPYLLHLDDAFEKQNLFVQQIARLAGQQINARKQARLIRLWGNANALQKLKAYLREQLYNPANQQPKLIFMGSGDFHHVSALLIELLAETTTEPFTIIHFDRHPDWVKFNNGMHCGSWAQHILKHKQVTRVITIGAGGKDFSQPEKAGAALDFIADEKLIVLPWEPTISLVKKQYNWGAGHKQFGRQIIWEAVNMMAPNVLADFLIRQIPTRHIYMTIDKDVLPAADAATNWDQGGMPLAHLIQVVQSLQKNSILIGVDVIGDYSKPRYGGSWFSQIAKWFEARLDQSWQPPKKISDINTASNLRLLECFMEAAT